MNWLNNIFFSLFTEEGREQFMLREQNRKAAADFFYRGNTHFQLRQLEDALYEFTRTIELNPKFTGAYINRGNVYFHMKNLEDALKDYDKAIELGAHVSGLYFNRACLYDLRGQYDLA